jgi:hypothetical protein
MPSNVCSRLQSTLMSTILSIPLTNIEKNYPASDNKQQNILHAARFEL